MRNQGEEMQNKYAEKMEEIAQSQFAGAQSAVSKEKHVMLHSSITTLEMTVDSVSNIIDRITGSPANEKVPGPPDDEKMPGPPDRNPSLFDILEHGPERIDQTCREIETKLQEISNLLF